MLEPFHQIACRRKDQPDLAASARSSVCQQTVVLQQPPYLGQLTLPSDEAGEFRWQVVGRARAPTHVGTGDQPAATAPSCLPRRMPRIGQRVLLPPLLATREEL